MRFRKSSILLWEPQIQPALHLCVGVERDFFFSGLHILGLEAVSKLLPYCKAQCMCSVMDFHKPGNPEPMSQRGSKSSFASLFGSMSAFARRNHVTSWGWIPKPAHKIQFL